MPMRAQSGGGGTASTYSHLSFRMGWTVSTTSRCLTPKKELVRIKQKASWASGPVWTDK